MSNQPPRFAAWIVDVFTPPAQVEAMRGDLLEEFAELAQREGEATARAWYWRQSLKTVCQLFAAAFRRAPWTMAAAIAAGWLTDSLSMVLNGRLRVEALLEAAAAFVLKRFPVYHYINAHLFWTIYDPGLINQVLIGLTAGWVAGAIARGRETIAATSLGLLWGVPAAVSCLWWPPLRPHELRVTIPFFLFRIVLVNSVLMVIGGGIARKMRALAGRYRIRAGA